MYQLINSSQRRSWYWGSFVYISDSCYTYNFNG